MSMCGDDEFVRGEVAGVHSDTNFLISGDWVGDANLGGRSYEADAGPSMKNR